MMVKRKTHIEYIKQASWRLCVEPIGRGVEIAGGRLNGGVDVLEAGYANSNAGEVHQCPEKRVRLLTEIDGLRLYYHRDGIPVDKVIFKWIPGP